MDAVLMAWIKLSDNFASGPLKVRIQWWTDAFAQVQTLPFLRAIDATAHLFNIIYTMIVKEKSFLFITDQIV
jgi:hypothetical protein